MSNLIKASELAGPHISGVVSVPLVELDKMRADHSTAIMIAKELESKQGLVKVIHLERYQEMRYDDYSRESHAYPVVKYRETHTEYKNFEDFRAQITKEEQERIQEKFKEQEERINSDQNKIADLTEALTKSSDSLSKLEEELDEIKLKITSLEEENNQLEEELEEASIKMESLDKKYLNCLMKKSFWAWLNSKF